MPLETVYLILSSQIKRKLQVNLLWRLPIGWLTVVDGKVAVDKKKKIGYNWPICWYKRGLLDFSKNFCPAFHHPPHQTVCNAYTAYMLIVRAWFALRDYQRREWLLETLLYRCRHKNILSRQGDFVSLVSMTSRQPCLVCYFQSRAKNISVVSRLKLISFGYF